MTHRNGNAPTNCTCPLNLADPTDYITCPIHDEPIALSADHGEGWVAGHCPACGRESLDIMAGGHITCSRLDCPNPTAVDDLLHARVTPPASSAPTSEDA